MLTGSFCLLSYRKIVIVRMIVPPHAKDSNMNDGKPSKRPAPNRAPCPHKARFLAVLCPLNKQTILI